MHHFQELAPLQPTYSEERIKKYLNLLDGLLTSLNPPGIMKLPLLHFDCNFGTVAILHQSNFKYKLLENEKLPIAIYGFLAAMELLTRSR